MQKSNVKGAAGATGIQVTDRAIVGLDVHKRTIAAAIRVNGEQTKRCSMPAEPAVVVRTLEPYRAGLELVV